MRGKIATVLLGILIGSLAGYGHVQSVHAQPRCSIKVVEIEDHPDEENLIVYMDEEIPDEVELAAYKYGHIYQIDPELLEAIAYYESRYQADVDSKTGTYKGLMQIGTKWHKDRIEKLGVTDLHDADQNMMVAADYLSDLFEQYEDAVTVLKRYSGSSTTKYSNKVLNKAEQLKIKHGKVD